MKPDRKEVAWIILIVLLALSLRVYRLADESLWLDEGGAVRTALLSPGEIVEDVAESFHPPLYFLILHGWIGLGGEGEFNVRLLSVLIGACSVFVIYRVGSLLFDRTTGLWASLLLALSRFNIYYSQEGRMYGLLALLTLVSIYYFIRLIRKNSIPDGVFYLLFSTLLIYTHNVGVFIIIAQNLYLLVSRGLWGNRGGISLKIWLLLQTLLVVFYLPWLTVVLNQFQKISRIAWTVPRPEAATLLHTLMGYCGSQPLRIFFVVLALAAFISIRRAPAKSYRWEITPSDPEKNLWLLIWLATPVFLPFVISQFVTPIYMHKATIGAWPALYLLAGRGIGKIRSRYLRAPVVIALVALSLVNLRHYYRQTYRDRWREAVCFIDGWAVDGDLIVCDPPSTFRDIFDYYRRKTGLGKKRITMRSIDLNPENVRKVISGLEDADRVWVVLSHRGLDDDQMVEEEFGGSRYLARFREYSNRANMPFHGYRTGLKVYLFVKKLKAGLIGEDDIPRFTRYLREEGNDNVLRDSGFEGEGHAWNRAEEWVSGETVHAGKRAIHIKRGMVPESNFHILNQGPIKLKAGQDYIFGAFIKTERLRDDIRVEIREINGLSSSRYHGTPKIGGDNDWTLLIGVFKTGTGPGQEDIEIFFRPARLNNFREGEFWVDDAFIIPYNRFPRY